MGFATACGLQSSPACVHVEVDEPTAKRLLEALSPSISVLNVLPDEHDTLASTDDEARVQVLETLFTRLFGTAPQHVALAGGRVNLIGEHVDYPDVQFAGRPSGTKVVHLYVAILSHFPIPFVFFGSLKKTQTGCPP